jgi:hypothetical protein
MTGNQGRWIEDNSASGESHCRFLRASSEKEGKIGWQSPEKQGQVDLGF